MAQFDYGRIEGDPTLGYRFYKNQLR